MRDSVDLLFLPRCGRLPSRAASAQRANLMLLPLLPVLLLFDASAVGAVNTGPDGGEIIFSLVTYHNLFLASSLQFSSCIEILVIYRFSYCVLPFRRGSAASSHSIVPGSIPGAITSACNLTTTDGIQELKKNKILKYMLSFGCSRNA